MENRKGKNKNIEKSSRPRAIQRVQKKGGKQSKGLKMRKKKRSSMRMRRGDKIELRETNIGVGAKLEINNKEESQKLTT